MAVTVPAHAYKTLNVPVGCEDDQLIENAYCSCRKQPIPETATAEERDTIVRKIFLRRLSYACICSSTRRSIYHQVSGALQTLLQKPITARVISVAPQINWTDDHTRALVWKAWAKTILQSPVGFQSIGKAKWFDTTVLRGTLNYVSITVSAKLTISITAQFYKANQMAMSIETVRLDKQAISTGNAVLFSSHKKNSDLLKEAIPDISATAVDQLSPFVSILQCTTGNTVPKTVEVKDTQELSIDALRDAFTDDAIMELTKSLIECAGKIIEDTELKVVESIAEKYPGFSNLSLSISNVEVVVNNPSQHLFSAEAGGVAVLQVPIAVQGYKWDQTLRYVIVNLLTGNMCGTVGVSKSKQGIGKFAALFKGKGKEKGKERHKGVSQDSTTPSTQPDDSTSPVLPTPPQPSANQNHSALAPPPPPAAASPAPSTPTASAPAPQPTSEAKQAATFFINKKMLGPIDSDTSSSD